MRPDVPFEYELMAAKMLVPRSLLEDAGILKPMRHSAWIWPELVLFPRLHAFTTRAHQIREDVSNRLHLARLALTDPAALEGDDEW